jgi:hypothetical protein
MIICTKDTEINYFGIKNEPINNFINFGHMLNDILNIANMYAEGVKHVQDRRAQWLLKHKDLKEHLKEIADNLNANAAYKQGFFIDTLHAFNEDTNGTCADMPSISFRSGEMPMLVTFRNSMGERKEYMEQGFHITFNPMITGQILVLLFPHYSDLNKTPPPYTTLAIIDEPGQMTPESIDQIIISGMHAAFYSSFTGISETQQENEQNDSKPPHQQYPIGFKRYETTEKVK